MTIAQLIERLQELPQHWEVWATKSGDSLHVREPDGLRYGFVFTSAERPTRLLTYRRQETRRDT